MTDEADRYKLTEAQHQAIFDKRIKPHLFADAKPMNRPVGVVFGGQPGAGKSPAVDAAVHELKGRGGAAQIIGDDLRGYHPSFGRLMELDDKTAAFYTDRDTGRWVEKAIAYAKQQQFNVVIEGTMRDGNKVAETLQALRGSGYEVDVRAIAVNERVSWQGVLQRYEAQKADRGSGRMTAPQAHAAAYEGMPRTLERIEAERLADRVTIYKRGAVEIYRNELQGGDWSAPPSARAAVEQERARPMSLQERRAYAEAFDKLVDQIDRPERGATQDERRAMEQLRREARSMVVAQVFRQAEPEQATREFPELAGAYGALSAITKKAEQAGFNDGQRTMIKQRAAEQIAAGLERGEAPAVDLRVEVTRAPSRDGGHER